MRILIEFMHKWVISIATMILGAGEKASTRAEVFGVGCCWSLEIEPVIGRKLLRKYLRETIKIAHKKFENITEFFRRFWQILKEFKRISY